MEVPPEDAIYTSTLGGKSAFGSENDYEIRFTADEMPPCDAFWSITIYDLDGYPVNAEGVANVVGTPHGLVYEDDGSVVIYISRESPGELREPNWLPAPTEGNFVLTGRCLLQSMSTLTCQCHETCQYAADFDPIMAYLLAGAGSTTRVRRCWSRNGRRRRCLRSSRGRCV